MNEIDKIVTLLEKGYTKAEIDAMFNASTETVEPAPLNDPENAEAVIVPASEPSEVIPTADDPVPKTLPEQLTTFMDEMRSSIADLTSAIQARNIQTNSIDTTKAEDMNDLLAAYINPPRVNK